MGNKRFILVYKLKNVCYCMNVSYAWLPGNGFLHVYLNIFQYYNELPKHGVVNM